MEQERQKWACEAAARDIKCKDILNICAELNITVAEYMKDRFKYIDLYAEKTGICLME